jgi:hypothetical protein
MQVKFALDPTMRRATFVNGALLYPPEMIHELEPVQVSPEARELLAVCNPDLPDVFSMLAPAVDTGADDEAGRLWLIKENPNAFTTAEIVEMWVREYQTESGNDQSVF